MTRKQVLKLKDEYQAVSKWRKSLVNDVKKENSKVNKLSSNLNDLIWQAEHLQSYDDELENKIHNILTNSGLTHQAKVQGLQKLIKTHKYLSKFPDLHK